jgi:hypothetical protein
MIGKKTYFLMVFTLLIFLPFLSVLAANKPPNSVDKRALTNRQTPAVKRLADPPDYAITSVTVKRSGGRIMGSALMVKSGTGEIPGTKVCVEARSFKGKSGGRCGSNGQLLDIMDDRYPDIRVTAYGRVVFPAGRGDFKPQNDSLKVELFPNQQQATRSR